MADTDDEVQDCRSEEGQTTGLIDSLLFISREVATRDLSPERVQAALEDLLEDPAFQKVLDAHPRGATTASGADRG
ncbi:hypothetical protein OG900_33330 [Streptomyces sp. NBC_00433]